MFNAWTITGIALAVLLICWFIKGRDEKPTKTLETTPPCDPIQMGYMLDGMISERTVVAAILYWKNKEYLEVNGDSIRIISVPKTGYEERLFRALFKSNKSVKIGALSVADTFGVDNEIKRTVNEQFYAGNTPFKSIENYIYAATWIFMGCKNPAALMIFFFLNWVAVVLLKRQIAEIRSSEKVVVTRHTLGTFLIMAMAFVAGPLLSENVMAGTVFYLAGSFLLAIMDKRSNINLYGRIKGYGDYLKTAEYDKFIALRKTDSQYGNDLLPYFVLFGLGTPETDGYVDAISKDDRDASKMTRMAYLNTLNPIELKKEPFKMIIQQVAQFGGMQVVNGYIDSGMLVWNTSPYSGRKILVSDIYIWIPLTDGTRKKVKVEQIAVIEDRESTIDMAVKGDHITFALQKGIIKDIQQTGIITLA